jgi:hypothetical protein
LSCVEVYVQRISAVGGPLILEIQSVSAGVPTGSVLATASVAQASVPTTLSFISFDISSAGLMVAIGDQLAIVLRGDLLPVNDTQWYNWEGEAGASATYSGGYALSRLNADPWNDLGQTWDWAFPTYVTDPAVPVQPTTWGAIKSQYRDQ